MKTDAILLSFWSYPDLSHFVLSAGCAGTAPGENKTPLATTTTTPAAGANLLRVATTTRLENTGLLAELEQVYEDMAGVDLPFIVRGTGQSPDTARRDDVDLGLVHSSALEEAFVNGGFATNPRCITYNNFIIVGPEADPAGISSMSPVEGFQKINIAGTNNTPGVTIVSRGDNAGIPAWEKALWMTVGCDYEKDILNSVPLYAPGCAESPFGCTCAGPVTA